MGIDLKLYSLDEIRCALIRGVSVFHLKKNLKSVKNLYISYNFSKYQHIWYAVNYATTNEMKKGCERALIQLKSMGIAMSGYNNRQDIVLEVFMKHVHRFWELCCEYPDHVIVNYSTISEITIDMLPKDIKRNLNKNGKWSLSEG
jgi:hypothetical protein